MATKQNIEREKIQKFYSHEMEKDRLDSEIFYLEGIRTKEIISRYLFSGKLNIIDIGGGAGYYAFWLQEAGHNVTLVDLSPVNIELAKNYSKKSGIQLALCKTGDATALDFEDEQFDIALLLGPLYHLTRREERLQAISEAKRVLKPGGILLAATISRYASLMDGFKRDLVNDDRFYKVLVDDLKTGVHLNETDNLEYFTTAYFHTAEEIRDEVGSCGLTVEKIIGVESFGWFVDDIMQKANDANYMSKLLSTIKTVESNEDLIAISPHWLTIAKK